MRVVRAGLCDVVHVHKLFLAYHQDIGKVIDAEEVFNQWIGELTNENKYYVLILHGRKALGMLWGESLRSGFRVDGIFLKRAWRGKFRFSKYLLQALLEKKKKFGKLLISVPEGCEGINVKKFCPEHRVYSY